MKVYSSIYSNIIEHSILIKTLKEHIGWFIREISATGLIETQSFCTIKSHKDVKLHAEEGNTGLLRDIKMV